MRGWITHTASKILILLLSFSIVENLILLLQVKKLRSDVYEFQKLSRNVREDALKKGDVIGFLRMKYLNGASLQLSLEGAYFIFVFSVACPACKDNFSNWKEIETVTTQGRILYLSVDELSVIKPYALENNILDRVFIVAGQEEVRRLKVNQIPQTLFISNGVVQFSHVGRLKAEMVESLKLLSSQNK